MIASTEIRRALANIGFREEDMTHEDGTGYTLFRKGKTVVMVDTMMEIQPEKPDFLKMVDEAKEEAVALKEMTNYHPCPYQQDVNNNSKFLCNCDEAQMNECAADI